MSPWKRRLLIGTIVGFFAAAAIWIGTDRRIPQASFERYSVHNTAPDGLSLAYTYLRRTRAEGSEGTLSRPLERAFLEPDGVLLRIHPNSPVPPGLRQPPKPDT